MWVGEVHRTPPGNLYWEVAQQRDAHSASLIGGGTASCSERKHYARAQHGSSSGSSSPIPLNLHGHCLGVWTGGGLRTPRLPSPKQFHTSLLPDSPKRAEHNREEYLYSTEIRYIPSYINSNPSPPRMKKYSCLVHSYSKSGIITNKKEGLNQLTNVNITLPTFEALIGRRSKITQGILVRLSRECKWVLILMWYFTSQRKTQLSQPWDRRFHETGICSSKQPFHGNDIQITK